MSSLRSLKGRIKSVKNTEKLTNAMKTVATSKYNAAQTKHQSFEEYYRGCKRLLSRLFSGMTREDGRTWEILCGRKDRHSRVCYVLLTGNAGLCGSYNSDLVRYMSSLLDKIENNKQTDNTKKTENGETPLVIVCGHCGITRFKDDRASLITDFEFGDIPSPEESNKLALYLIGLWEKGEVNSISFVYQKYVNALTHSPTVETFLPFAPVNDQNAKDKYDEYIIFEPAREQILAKAADLCLKAGVYEKLLLAFAGAQNATLTAMRSAGDNSKQMLELLELQMNRIRQASVTTEVIEVSGANAQSFGDSGDRPDVNKNNKHKR